MLLDEIVAPGICDELGMEFRVVLDAGIGIVSQLVG